MCSNLTIEEIENEWSFLFYWRSSHWTLPKEVGMMEGAASFLSRHQLIGITKEIGWAVNGA